MNVLMVALSVQLALYGAAWLTFTFTFRIYPQASRNWAYGWLLSAAGTALLFFQPDAVAAVLDLIVNTTLILAFFSLQHGTQSFLRERWSWPPTLSAMALILALEVVRHTVPDSLVLRTWLFTLAANIPLALLLRDLGWRIPRRFGVGRINALLLAAPVALSGAAFIARAVAITFSEATGVRELDTGSRFDIAVMLLFFVFLGLFNFSLYNLVLGALIRKLETLSSTDQLTRLLNRRVIMERLVAEHARYARSTQPYAVLMLDVDHFKPINDTYGHATGDAVLQEVAQWMQSCVRTTDTLARIGGEEFMVLMPLSSLDGAAAQGERIRQALADSSIQTPTQTLRVTISVGAAQVMDTDRDAESVVSRADAALYRAKAGGRNRVETAT